MTVIRYPKRMEDRKMTEDKDTVIEETAESATPENEEKTEAPETEASAEAVTEEVAAEEVRRPKTIRKRQKSRTPRQPSLKKCLRRRNRSLRSRTTDICA